MIDYEFLYSFINKILGLHDSIIWVGITNKYSVLLATEKKQGAVLSLTDEENEEFSSSSITRHKNLIKLAPKIGNVQYAFGRYRNICRATVPINDNFYLLIMFDPVARNFDDVIMRKTIPMVDNEKSRFVPSLD